MNTHVPTRRVVCIKWGTKYPAYYVNRLYNGVRRHLQGDLRFICMTDDPTGIQPGVETIPIPNEPYAESVRLELLTSKRQGAFGKISLFKPGLFSGKGAILGFDLDVVITGTLDELFEHAPGRVCMRHDWLAIRRGRPDGHGSVFRFDPDLHGFLYNEFARDTVNLMRESKHSEQKYTSMLAQRNNQFAYFPGEWIASFKRDAMRTFPLNHLMSPARPRAARVVCFHGRPKMEEAVSGYSQGPLRTARPCGWLKDEWVGISAEADADQNKTRA